MEAIDNNQNDSGLAVEPDSGNINATTHNDSNARKPARPMVGLDFDWRLETATPRVWLNVIQTAFQEIISAATEEDRALYESIELKFFGVSLRLSESYFYDHVEFLSSFYAKSLPQILGMLSPEARRALFLHSVFYLAHGYQENRGAIIETAIRGLLPLLHSLPLVDDFFGDQLWVIGTLHCFLITYKGEMDVDPVLIAIGLLIRVDRRVVLYCANHTNPVAEQFFRTLEIILINSAKMQTPFLVIYLFGLVGIEWSVLGRTTFQTRDQFARTAFGATSWGTMIGKFHFYLTVVGFHMCLFAAMDAYCKEHARNGLMSCRLDVIEHEAGHPVIRKYLAILDHDSTVFLLSERDAIRRRATQQAVLTMMGRLAPQAEEEDGDNQASRRYLMEKELILNELVARSYKKKHKREATVTVSPNKKHTAGQN